MKVIGFSFHCAESIDPSGDHPALYRFSHYFTQTNYYLINHPEVIGSSLYHPESNWFPESKPFHEFVFVINGNLFFRLVLWGPCRTWLGDFLAINFVNEDFDDIHLNKIFRSDVLILLFPAAL